MLAEDTMDAWSNLIDPLNARLGVPGRLERVPIWSDSRPVWEEWFWVSGRFQSFGDLRSKKLLKPTTHGEVAL